MRSAGVRSRDRRDVSRGTESKKVGGKGRAEGGGGEKGIATSFLPFRFTASPLPVRFKRSLFPWVYKKREVETFFENSPRIQKACVGGRISLLFALREGARSS